MWDSFGRIIFASAAHDHPITSVKWAPDGSVFAVGSFNTLRLCDQAGWSHSLEKPDTGSLFGIAWAEDSTQLAAASGSGKIIFGSIVDRKLDWKSFEATLVQATTIKVFDAANGTTETLGMAASARM